MKQKLCLFLALVMLGTLVLSGCKEDATAADVKIWSTPNTSKVIQQTSGNDNHVAGEAKLAVSMMQGEYEGAQLLVTTGDQQLNYTMEPGQLKSADGTVFPAENVAIYHQKYIEVVANYSGNSQYPSGSMVPDMLMPMATAVAYGENVIPANSNQGITVEFHSQDVPAGTYTGSFKLTVGETAHDIPVTVTVWDFGYEGRRTFQSCFMLWVDELMAGEYENTPELMDTYVEFFNRYKADMYIVQDSSARTTEWFVEFAKKTFESNNTASIIIPYDFPLSYTAMNGSEPTAQAAKVIDYILAAAEISTPEKMYVDLLYFYASTYDEADINGTGAQSERFLCKGGEYDQTIDAAVAAIDTDPRFANISEEWKATLKESISTIPVLFTNVDFIENWVGELSAAFCPYSSLFGNESILQKYQDAANANSNGDLWMYTCMGPTYPYGTFHIDDGTLGMRVSGWMEKYWGITGYLYYAVNMNTQFRLTEEVFTDMYSNSLRYENVPGDGYLVYPGRYYGSSEPFATVRLASYRDSQDDYDMLCVYENLLMEYAQAYGIEIQFNDYVQDLYSSLFNGAVHYTDPMLVYAAREELARRILDLKENGILVTKNTKQTLVYGPADATVKVNGAAVNGEAAGSGKVFAVESGAIEVTVGGKQYTYEAGAIVSAMQDITLSEDSTMTLNGNRVEAVIKSVYRGDDDADSIGSQTRMFTPSISFAVSEVKAGNVIRFSYTNSGAEDLEMNIVLVEKSGKATTVKSNYCGKGDTRQVSIALSSQLAEKLGIDLSSVCEIRLSFSNVVNNANGSVMLCPDRYITVADVRIEK